MKSSIDLGSPDRGMSELSTAAAMKKRHREKSLSRRDDYDPYDYSPVRPTLDYGGQQSEENNLFCINFSVFIL